MNWEASSPSESDASSSFSDSVVKAENLSESPDDKGYKHEFEKFVKRENLCDDDVPANVTITNENPLESLHENCSDMVANDVTFEHGFNVKTEHSTGTRGVAVDTDYLTFASGLSSEVDKTENSTFTSILEDTVETEFSTCTNALGDVVKKESSFMSILEDVAKTELTTCRNFQEDSMKSKTWGCNGDDVKIENSMDVLASKPAEQTSSRLHGSDQSERICLDGPVSSNGSQLQLEIDPEKTDLKAVDDSDADVSPIKEDPYVEIDVAGCMEGIFSCTQCDLTFPTDALLEGHSQQSHRDLLLRKRQEWISVSRLTEEGEKLPTVANGLNLNNCNDVFDSDGKEKLDNGTTAYATTELVVRNKPNHRTFHDGEKSDNCDKSDVMSSCERVNTGEKPHCCSGCDEVFVEYNELMKHLMSAHTGGQPHRCPFCDKVFNWNNDRKLHIMTIHSGEKPYICSVCGEAFAWSSDLQRHMVGFHPEEKPNRCSLCGKVFSTIDQLRRHMKRHAGEKRFICSVCDKAFVANNDLRRHKATHAVERLHKCTVCGKAFIVKPDMKVHMVRVHKREKPHQCSVCDRAFGLRNDLRQHILRKHTKEKPHRCSFCDQSFCSIQELRDHTFKIHTGEKPHRCSVCDKAFLRESELKQHVMRIHDRKKSHQCSLCYKAFFEGKTLREHMMRMHSKEKLHQSPMW